MNEAYPVVYEFESNGGLPLQSFPNKMAFHGQSPGDTFFMQGSFQRYACNLLHAVISPLVQTAAMALRAACNRAKGGIPPAQLRQLNHNFQLNHRFYCRVVTSLTIFRISTHNTFLSLNILLR